MSVIPSHLANWSVIEEIPTDGYLHQVALRCPCGSDHFQLSYSGAVDEHQGTPYPTGIRIADGYHFLAAVKCKKCGGECCVYDWGIHGCTGLRGWHRVPTTFAKPATRQWNCMRCGTAEHRAVIRYTLLPEEEYQQFIHPKYPATIRADAFVWVGMDIRCCGCDLFTWLWFESETDWGPYGTADSA